MLRITLETPRPDERRVRLEGRLAGPWVDELRRVSSTSESGRARLVLDLAALHFADAEGLALLRELHGEAVELRNASAFVRALLAETQP